MNYTVRKATVDDARAIAPILRRMDRYEIYAATGKPPVAVLPLAFAVPGHDTIYATTGDGSPILIAGVQPVGTPRCAAIWMLGTPLLEDYAFRFPREAIRKINEWNTMYPMLFNRALESNSFHMRWLEFLGFRFLGRTKVRGRPFIEFARHKTNV